ncbi:sensor domain-containing phosphodiesterase [Dermatobacter hominis]|uniref:sensor domain-containing phosphodiesterase n=1 Tax=Dermatobacter hominis TaxID=2884263 RepID=UPI001D12B1CA|nr:EAL domain-containing protein [Dermatobacter hominis]UDY38093.1 EAL domain-containing protein [Dermatobacter hominis]
MEAPDTGVDELTGAEDLVRRLLDVARTRTDTDMTWVSRFRADRMELVLVSGSLGTAPVEEGWSSPYVDSYCARVLDGRIGNVVSDTLADPETCGLDATVGLGIRSYVGVPVKAPNGAVTGMLCAVSARPRTIDDREQEFLQMLADTASDLLRDVPIVGDDRRRIRDRVGRVINHGLLRTVFQPIVDLEHSRVVGFEALSRFPGEPARPDQWFADAIAVGLGVALEVHAARTAIEAMPELPEGTYLSVNLSPTALMSIDLDELMPEDPTRLVIELTEHARVGDYQELRTAVQRLRAAGVRIAVDDAGAGFASFRHILELGPDIVKVDLSISQGIADDPARQALVGGMAELAHQSGATLVAEGVEDPRDLDRLSILGVSVFQGYLFGRPSPLPVSDRLALSSLRPPTGRTKWPSEPVIETRFESAIMSSAVPTAIVELDGTLRSVNQHFAAFLRRSVADVEALTFQDLTHPDDLETDLCHLRQCLADQRDSYRITKRYLDPSGQPMPADLIVTVVRDRSRRPLYFISHVLPL